MLWSVLVLLLGWSLDDAAASVIVRDDDCEHVGDEALVDWQDFLAMLKAPRTGLHDAVVLHIMHHRAEAEKQCQLGTAAACLYIISKHEIPQLTPAEGCVTGISLLRVLHTRWPLFRLLWSIQRNVRMLGLADEGRSCDSLYHPSIEWRGVRQNVDRYVDDIANWFDSGMPAKMPSSMQEVSSETSGIYWKSFSETAVVDGRTIRSWTLECEDGIYCVHAIRTVMLLFARGDVYRLVQRCLETLAGIFEARLDILLKTPWPVLGILHILNMLKHTEHDSVLVNRDLIPWRTGHTPGADTGEPRSAAWRKATHALQQRAGGDGQSILLTYMAHMHLSLLQPMLKHANTLGYLHKLAIIPLERNMTWLCSSITSGFIGRYPEGVNALNGSSSPCLPFVSRFMGKARYMYTHLALQLNLAVLWYDIRVFWLQNPVFMLAEYREGVSSPVPYHHGCRGKQPALEADVYAIDEFYADTLTRPSLLLFRPTPLSKQLAQMMLTFVCTYPYADEHAGIRYALHPDRMDLVPSVSMIPDPDEIPRVKVGELNTEVRHVSTDGWFGNYEDIVSFEISNVLNDHLEILEKLLKGTEEDRERSITLSKKVVSPLRPIAALYQNPEDLRRLHESCDWEYFAGRYIGGYADPDNVQVFNSLEDAKSECIRLGSACYGITCDRIEQSEQPDSLLVGGCTLRRGTPKLEPSPSNEGSFVKGNCASAYECKPQRIDRIVHVNYADGCCEVEQNLSSETAVKFGAHESRPLRGDFLSEEFRLKNEYLLKFNRTPDLTMHKTPSGKIGYYVWKPYVILRTLQDPALPWDTSVVVWSDAGIHFVGDMTPLVHEYMAKTDVASTRTPMTESEFSKRDAFILLDADYLSIAETRQIATGFIIARKTTLAIEFMSTWLRACEEPRIMTELPSQMGFPEHIGFRNSNDDQTAFSLLFKRFGFVAFSVDERDAVVHTGRNLAKFIKASDDFALGKQGSRDDYLQAAEAAAESRRT